MSLVNDYNIEPKKQLLNLLTITLFNIRMVIYHLHDYRAGLNELKGLIDILDENSQKALAKQREQIVSLLRSGKYERNQVETVVQTVSVYLHKTYLQEMTMGLIPTSTLPCDGKTPEKIKIEAHRTSRL